MVRSAQLIGDRGARGFAVLRADGGVNCWGHPSFGGDCDLEMCRQSWMRFMLNYKGYRLVVGSCDFVPFVTFFFKEEIDIDISSWLRPSSAASTERCGKGRCKLRCLCSHGLR